MRDRLWSATGLGPLLATVLPALLFVYLRRLAPHDPVFHVPGFHFVVVTATSLAASVVAVAIGLAGLRQRNLQVIFLGLAFMSLSMVFAVHGLATPGFLLGPTRLVSVAAQLSVLLAALWLGVSSVSSASAPARQLAAGHRLLVPLWGAVLAALGAAGLRWPHALDGLPLGDGAAGWVVTGLTAGVLAPAAVRYWQAYRYSRFPLQLVLVYICGWLAVAQGIMTAGPAWHLSWWTYHGLLLLAVVAAVVGLVRQYGYGTSTVEAVRGLLAEDPVRRLQSGLSDSVRALIVATEARDPYTAGHSYRVALSAVQLGEAMGLSGQQLRALAQGALLHDVGKFEIPEAILNKEGPLTPEERRIVERHPVAGARMCGRLGFLQPELGIIRAHHERWDGSGYPDGLAGEQIPLLARIVAVVDVYDALTSERSYRRAWSHEQARAYILGHAGLHFDPRCVEVWSRLTADGPLPLPQPVRPLRPAPAGPR